MQSAVFSMSSLTAAEAVFGKRGLPPQTKPKTPEFWDYYDNDTLIYDCIWQPKEKRVRIVAPKFLNFKDTLLGARFVLDGKQAQKPRLRAFRQFDILDIPAAEPVRELQINVGAETLSLHIHHAELNRYAGKNVLLTKIKNDDPVWVCDWAAAHQRNHGTNAVLVIDNGSTAYDSETLRAALATVDGIEVADVLQAPHRHGTKSTFAQGSGWTKFHQSACLNLARDRFLSTARAVMVCDVDELVVSTSGKSIYDATATSPLKYKAFIGTWRYRDASDKTPRHADHIFSNPSAPPCRSKYCVVPDSILGRSCWSVHSLDAVNGRIFYDRKNFFFYHCHSISTGWKGRKDHDATPSIVPDAATEAFMKQTFGDRP